MDIAPEGVGEISWRVLPDDKTPNFVQIWLSKVNDVDGPQQVEVFGRTAARIPKGEAAITARQRSSSGNWGPGWGSYLPPTLPRSDGSRECITIATRPTAYDHETGEPRSTGAVRLMDDSHKKHQQGRASQHRSPGASG